MPDEQPAVILDEATPGDLGHRAPDSWLNYPGDVVDNVLARVDTPMGPTMDFGAYQWVVTAEYDEATDRTRVGLSMFPPPQVPQAA